MGARSCSAGVYQIAEATAARLSGGSGAATVWTIDGAGANSRASFFAALAAALQFPDFFGHNWDAVYDCLTDLASADRRPVVLLISGGEAFLAGMGAEWTTGQRVFRDAAAFWQEGGRRLLMLLVSDAALTETPPLSQSCLEQVLSPPDAGYEISLADERIRMLNRAGRFDDALRLAQDLVTRFPANPRAHFVLGGTFDFQDRELDAVAPYQRAWKLGLTGDDVPRFYVQYGSTLRNVGQFAEAVRVLEEGKTRFPEYVPLQAFLALALFSAGRMAEALAAALTIVAENSATIALSGYERALREYVAALLEPEAAHRSQAEPSGLDLAT